MGQLVHVTQAVTVRVEQASIVQGLGDTSPLSPGPCLVVVARVAAVATVCVCRLALWLLGAVLVAAGMLASLLGPTLQAAGGAAIEASKGGCDCVRD